MENRELELAWKIVENTGSSLFLTGKAGTGKTTFLRKVREESTKRLVVLAPTGIAAINAGGVTIHSFFQLPFAPFVPGTYPGGSPTSQKISRMKLKLIRSLDLIIIDEISMVRADLLDAVDAVLRRIRRNSRPFGGVQLLMIGDLQQLPPVVVESELQLLADHYRSFFFFESLALRSVRYETLELKKVYRQSDLEFISMLNSIRDNCAGPDVLSRLNTRCIPGFVPPKGVKYIRLTTHNEQARVVNARELDSLKGSAHTYIADVTGNFPESSFPCDRELSLKVGAQVMFVKNDPQHRFYNGMIGVVETLTDDKVSVRVDGGADPLVIGVEQWDNTRYDIDPATEEIREKVEGTFGQFPLRLAWAITIHKSQGLTFDHAIIDASRSFAHGQCYVALSRCRSLEGMVLERPLSMNAIICDRQVTDYITSRGTSVPDDKSVGSLMDSYRVSLLDELFDFTFIRNLMADCRHVVEEAFSGIYPGLTARWCKAETDFTPDIMEIARRFGVQYRGILADPETDGNSVTAHVSERIHAAIGYFLPKMAEIAVLVRDTPGKADNRKVEKRLGERMDTLTDMLREKCIVMTDLHKTEFTVDACLKARARAAMATGIAGKSLTSGKAPAKPAKKEKTWTPVGMDDVSNPELYRMLMMWRREKMKELDVPAFTIMSTKTLKAVAEAAPADRRELLDVAGVGTKTVERFADDILGIVKRFSR